MDARLDLFTNPVLGKFVKHLNSAARSALDAGVPLSTLELVELRASQINGCAYCVDMHSKDLAHHGETDDRLFAVSAWREAPFFTEAERAALALTEAATRLSDRADPVSDDVWDEAARHYDPAALGAIVLAIANINILNRINVSTRQIACEPMR